MENFKDFCHRINRIHRAEAGAITFEEVTTRDGAHVYSHGAMAPRTVLTRVPQHQVDAFAAGLYQGNPAAVVLLPPRATWPVDSVLQSIAVENNLSETAYVLAPDRAQGAPWRLRWFTPGGEVDLCGHATLATAHVVFTKVPHMAAANDIT